MTGDPRKPNLSNVRLVEFPPGEVEVKPPPPDHGARFVMALRRIADKAREAGLSEQDIRNLIAWDFPAR